MNGSGARRSHRAATAAKLPPFFYFRTAGGQAFQTRYKILTVHLCAPGNNVITGGDTGSTLPASDVHTHSQVFCFGVIRTVYHGLKRQHNSITANIK